MCVHNMYSPNSVCLKYPIIKSRKVSQALVSNTDFIEDLGAGWRVGL